MRCPNRAATVRERCAMKLIGCGNGGGPEETSPGGLAELSVGARGWGSRLAGGGRPRGLLVGVELASLAAGIVPPPPSFLLSGLIGHRLLACAARFAIPRPARVTERCAIPKPSRDREGAVCDALDRVRQRWRAQGTSPGASGIVGRCARLGFGTGRRGGLAACLRVLR